MTPAPTIQAIETEYHGCRFRSRLEARWAVFFDRAGIPWEYEPQGFVIEDRPYLPDFRLPDCGTWVEVKPKLPDRETLDFLRTAGSVLPFSRTPGCEGARGLLLLGPIPPITAPVVIPRWLEDPPDIGWRLLHEEEPDSLFGKVWDSWVGFGLYHKNGRPWWHAHEDVDSGSTALFRLDEYETMRTEIADAYRAATSARFEHGETPEFRA